MIFPQTIQDLQSNLLLEGTHLVANRRTLGLVIRCQYLIDLQLQLLFIELIILIKPLLDILLRGEFGIDRLL